MRSIKDPCYIDNCDSCECEGCPGCDIITGTFRADVKEFLDICDSVVNNYHVHYSEYLKLKEKVRSHLGGSE